MAKLNKGEPLKTPAIAYGQGPIATTVQDISTFEGAPAWSRNAKSDLFLLGVTNFYGEDTFYEKKEDRGKRFKDLVRQVAQEDPEWLLAFVKWLRHEGNIRTAAIVAAVEGARVLRESGQTGHEPGYARQIVRDTILRADEPAEALAYYLSTYGKRIPLPIRRGISDAAVRLYNERNFIKWDGSGPVRMADVVELTHPDPQSPEQSTLFKYMIDTRHRATEVPEDLLMLRTRKTLLDAPDKAELLRHVDAVQLLQKAGMTWEQVSSWGKFTAATWQALIPTMGYMALLRNLRNFQEAGIDAASIKYVQDTLSNPEEVAKSRQFPYRFLSAYLNAEGAQWAEPLEKALQASLQNLPAFGGRTLVLVDTSGSMQSLYSAKSKIPAVMAGALFGVALAAKGEQVDLFGFADGIFEFPVKKGASVLRTTERFVQKVGSVGYGTRIAESLRHAWSGHDRVIIVTDCQTFGSYMGNVADQIPTHIPIYAFNMMGYAPAMMETGSTRHELGGLTDATFRIIPLIEAGQKADWPWINSES
jgi:predicted RecA/RadA family phage recombinase